jgi:antitoxin VapB
MPSLNIKDPEVYAIATELARRTGTSLTEVVRESLRNSLQAEKARRSGQSRTLNRVMEIAERVSSYPVLDSRSPEEILGYDENGLPGRA